MKQEQGQEEVGVRLYPFLSKGAKCMCATPPIQGCLEMVGGEVAQNSSDGCLGELGTTREAGPGCVQTLPHGVPFGTSV